MFNSQSAFATPLEVLRAIAKLLDFQTSNKKELDDLISSKSIHLNKLDRFIKSVFSDNIKKILPGRLGEELNNYFIENMRSYRLIVSVASVDGLTREQVMENVTSFYIPFRLNNFIMEVLPENVIESDGIPINDIFNFDKDKKSVQVVLNWLNHNKTWSEYIKNISEDEKKKIKRWERGEYSFSFIELVNLGNVRSNPKEWEYIKFWLLVARGLDSLRRTPNTKYLFEMIKEAYDLYQKYGCKAMLKFHGEAFERNFALMQDQAFSTLKNASEHFAKLNSMLFRTKSKANIFKDDVLSELEKYKEEAEKVGKFETCKYHYDWFKARYYVFSGDLEKAVEHYALAFDNALYRAGDQLKQIIQEALVTASFFEMRFNKSQRKFLAHLKNSAVFFQYELSAIETKQEKLNHKDVVTVWEVDMWARSFETIFPKNGWFNDVNYDLFNSRIEDLTFEYEKTSSSLKLPSDFENQPDFKHPNKMVDFRCKKMPQLVYFSMLYGFFSKVDQSKTDEILDIVKKLLESGADVNKLSSENESALLFSLDMLNIVDFTTGSLCNRQLFDLLSEYTHSVETVNAKTSKQEKYPLMLAVKSGQSDIVEKVLGMGALPDQINIEKKTPLYVSLSMYFELEGGMSFSPYLTQVERDEILRRAGKAFYDMASPDLYHMEKAYHEMAIEQFRKYGNKEELQKIIELLLVAKADPNYRHNVNLLNGYTPLMLAIEKNDPQMFELLKEYGGDTKLSFTFRGMTFTCEHIKWKWRSDDIIL